MRSLSEYCTYLPRKQHLNVRLGSTASLREQLSFFPEFSKVEDMQANGKFSLAVPELERMHEVLQHNVETTSPITLFTVRQIAEAARLSGDKIKARGVLTASIEQLGEGPDKVHLLTLRAHQSLVNGYELDEAKVDAQEAVRICESYEECIQII